MKLRLKKRKKYDLVETFLPSLKKQMEWNFGLKFQKKKMVVDVFLSRKKRFWV